MSTKTIHIFGLNFVADALFFIAITVAIFSGLLISDDSLAQAGIYLNAGAG